MKYLLLAVLLFAPSAPAWSRAGGGGGGGGGGCFPAGTPVLTAAGEVPIETLRAGDRVLAFSENRLLEVEVKAFIEKPDRLVSLYTDKGALTATAEHPLLTPDGFKEVRHLEEGGEAAVLAGGRLAWAKIKSIRSGGTAKVYNLEVAPPHTFIAAGFIVHNKGGFGGGYSGGSSSGYSSGYSGRRRRQYGLFDLIFMGVIFLVLTVKNWFTRTSHGGASGGYPGGHSGYNGYGAARASAGPVLQADRVASRAEATAAILRALGRRDPAFNPAALENFAKDVFLKVQSAWQNRDYSGLRGLMMPHLHASYASKAESMRVRGEINMMENVQVLRADFVHVRCPREKEGRSVTVLFTASAKDYTINERHPAQAQAVSVQPQTFQEYWTFHQLNGEWALARVDQTGEMDFLNAPNLPSDPQGAGGIPPTGKAGSPEAGDAAYQPRPAFSPAPPAAEDPFQRGAELLKSIVPAAVASGFARPPVPPPQPKQGQPEEPIWDRQKMEIAATLAFENVYEAWGRNDALISADFVSAEALARLRDIMNDRRTEGITFEFRQLFVRRAEVVLTSPAAKSPLRLDEFTARINATAIRTMLRNGRPLHREEAPTPFTEYWVFGRQNKSWKLRDILPRMDQECEDRAKDGAPTPAQIEWYWQA